MSELPEPRPHGRPTPWSLAILVVVGSALVGLGAPDDAAAGPRASRLTKELRTFLSVPRQVRGEVQIEVVSDDGSALGPPVGRAFSLVRGEHVTLGEHRLPLLDVKKRRGDPRLRVVVLALVPRRPVKAIRRLKVRFKMEVLTLDRIAGRYVWAIGDDRALIWVDRELTRPVMMRLGKGVIDDHGWVVRYTYDDAGAGRGWFPSKVEVLRDEVLVWRGRFRHVRVSKKVQPGG